MGFWGEPTASIDWCETNYENSFYIAEYWNTLSNILLVVFSMFGMHMSIKEGHEIDLTILFFIIMVIGIGSALFHGTLQTWAQQLDETPMIYAITQWNFVLWREKLPGSKLYWRYAVWIHNLAFTVIHGITQSVIEFQLYFVAWVTLGVIRLFQMYRNEFKDSEVVKRLIRIYCFVYLAGSTVWLIDLHFCKQIKENLPFNPQGHAWWHIAVGFAGYLGPATLAYYTSMHRSPTVEYRMLVLPYIATSNAKKK